MVVAVLRAIFFFALMLAAGSDARAISISYSFDSGAQDWALTGGTLTHQTSGGNPGGYLELKDTQSGSLFLAHAFSDLSGYNSGTLSFDARLVGNNGEANLSSFGQVTLLAGATSATLDFASNPSNANWTNYTAPLTAGAWGLSELNFLSLLTNVTEIRIALDAKNRLGDVTGFDNFTLAYDGETGNVPEPSTLALLLTALAGTLCCRYGRRGTQRNLAPSPDYS